MNAVNEVLGKLTYSHQETMLVFNKIDRIEDKLELSLLANEDSGQEIVHLSARTGEGIRDLEARVAARLDARSALLEIRLPLADGRLASVLRGLATVLEEEVVGDTLQPRRQIRERRLVRDAEKCTFHLVEPCVSRCECPDERSARRPKR